MYDVVFIVEAFCCARDEFRCVVAVKSLGWSEDREHFVQG